MMADEAADFPKKSPSGRKSKAIFFSQAISDGPGIT
jgi:hypothetical protein